MNLALIKTNDHGNITTQDSETLPGKMISWCIPTPKSAVTVHSTQSHAKTAYELLDVLGKSVSEGESSSNDVMIDISNLTPGIYFLRLRLDDPLSVKKLAKNKEGVISNLYLLISRKYR